MASPGQTVRVTFEGKDLDSVTEVITSLAGVSAVLTSTYIGRRIVQLEAFTPGDWVSVAKGERITHAMVVPTMLGRVLDLLDSPPNHRQNPVKTSRPSPVQSRTRNGRGCQIILS